VAEAAVKVTAALVAGSVNYKDEPFCTKYTSSTPNGVVPLAALFPPVKTNVIIQPSIAYHICTSIPNLNFIYIS